MKLLFLGDPHIKPANLDVFEHAIPEIYSLIDEHKPDVFVSLGDTLDTHGNINITCLSLATNFYLEVAKKCPVVILIGNHDRKNNSDFMSNIHPFVGLKSHPNILVVDQTVMKEYRTSTGVWNIIYVPYVAPGRFREALAHVNYSPTPDTSTGSQPGAPGGNTGPTPHLIIAHQEFKGCKMKAVESKHGDIWEKELPIIISGHIHEFQVLNNIVYVGTPFSHNYGDSPDKALMLITMTDKLDFTRLYLKTPPQRIVIYLNLSNMHEFTSMIPNNNVISGKETDLRGKTLVKAIITIDIADMQILKANEYYKALEGMVDKVVIKTTSGKTSIADNILKSSQKTDQPITIEQIVMAMLNDDTETLELFKQIVS